MAYKKCRPVGHKTDDLHRRDPTFLNNSHLVGLQLAFGHILVRPLGLQTSHLMVLVYLLVCLLKDAVVRRTLGLHANPGLVQELVVEKVPRNRICLAEKRVYCLVGK
jgi:hypothetical protein